MSDTTLKEPEREAPEGTPARSPSAKAGVPGGDRHPRLFVTGPLTHLGILLVGFLLGVFLMVVLRSELRLLSALKFKMTIYLGTVAAVGLLLYPLYRRLSRGLHLTFGTEKGAALLYLVNFLMFGGGLLLFVLAGLYFVVLS